MSYSELVSIFEQQNAYYPEMHIHADRHSDDILFYTEGQGRCSEGSVDARDIVDGITYGELHAQLTEVAEHFGLGDSFIAYQMRGDSL